MGSYSNTRHPLHEKDVTEVGAGYDYFFYYATIHALQDKVSNIYGSTEMLEYSRSLKIHNWAVSDNHLLPFYILYLPLMKYSFSQGYYLHLWANLYLIWLAILALSLTLLPSRRHAYLTTILLIGGTLFLGTAADNIFQGQIGFAFTAVLAFAFLLDRIDYGAPAGICLALAILLKMYPALLLVYFALKHRWQTLKWTAYTLTAMGIAAGLQWGFARYIDYWHLLGQSGIYPHTIANQSLIGVLSVTCTYLSPQQLKIIHLCLIGLTVGGLSLLSRDLPKRSPNVHLGLLEYSVWLTAATIISPISWGHHHIFLVLPLLALLGLVSSPAPGNPPIQEALQTPSDSGSSAAKKVSQKKSKTESKACVPSGQTTAEQTENSIKASWNVNIKLSSCRRGLALVGILLIIVLWSFEGETITNLQVKAINYSFYAHHMGLVLLLSILAAEIAALTKE